ncbi:MAG: plasmid recombination protein [Mailhella sp.]|nr:plasmid recombination protein [Mailhella sp.]
MSYLVLHMDKFKRESLRGIQSHNRRERRSRSNPDIRHEKSRENCELHQPEVRDYACAVQARIDSLNLPKAVRKDAVVLCGLIVTSDLPFFARLSSEEQRRFFEESRDFLTRFVGRENVISAMIHRDEKTPHMHFLHVPVTPDGRLNANTIYTRESLRRLQSEMPEHLKACGFRIERGVEQVPGARRIHLNTREFKQEKEERERIAADNVKVLRHALDTLYAASELEEHLKGKIKEYEKQAREAERYLARNEELPEASMFNFKTVLAQAKRVIAEQKRALAEKAILEGRKQIADGLLVERNRELKELTRRIDRLLLELEEVKAQKNKAEGEVRAFKEFIAQPEEKLRFEQFLTDKQEEKRRAEMERQASLASRKLAPSGEDDVPSFSPR